MTMPSKEQRRTTADLPKALYHEVRVEAAKHEMYSWRQILLAALELWLAVKQGKLIVSNAPNKGQQE